MTSEDYMKIRVGKHSVGIMGLTAVLEETAEELAGKPEEEIREALLARLSKTNYISDSTRELYGDAFLREHKIYMGEPVAEEPPDHPEIKVLGEGCARCDQLERDVMEVMDEMGVMGDLEHIRDIREISRYGVMGTPALVINGKVVSKGSVPPKAKIEEWLKEAAEGGKTE